MKHLTAKMKNDIKEWVYKIEINEAGLYTRIYRK